MNLTMVHRIARREWIRATQKPKVRAKVASLLRSGAPIYLELGAGAGRGRLPNWIATDISDNQDLYLNLTQPFPFPDGSVDKIYSSHVLEHFSYLHPLQQIFSESFRVLKKGGIFSAAVPNARLWVEAYCQPETSDSILQRFYGADTELPHISKMDLVNRMAYMSGEHHHLFDEVGLLAMMEAAGFTQGRVREFDPDLDLETRREGSLYVEAVRE